MVVVQLLGGMGNQMFQYVVGRYLSLLNQTPLLLDTSFISNRTPVKNFVYRNFDLDIFNISAKVADESDIPLYPEGKSIKSIPHRVIHLSQLWLKGFTYVKDFNYNEQYLKQKSNIYLDGYFQKELYFSKIESVIRTDFSFKYDLEERSQKLKQAILSTNSVCLNVRRGDFLTDKNIAVLDLEYFQKAVIRMESSVESPHFFIFSDDIEWCISNIKLNHPCIFVTHEYKGEKFRDYLQLMSLCKHFIIPNSTFAWWAALLSNNAEKIVIAPKRWLKDPKLENPDLVPSAWVTI